jgi:hypothetical protein
MSWFLPMKSFYVLYHDRSYLVRLRETMGVNARAHPEEWVVFSGNRMVAAVPYREPESREELEARVLTALSTRIQ